MGKVIKIDYNTFDMLWGKFAPIVVLVDMRKPLKSKVSVKNRVQQVEYESLPQIYFECG